MKLISIILIFCTPLLAEDFIFDKESGKAIPSYVGQVKEIRGEVFKLDKGKQVAVKAGERFYKKDSIVTQSKSFAKILIVDDSILNLGQNSELNFEEFKFVDKTDRHIIYSFIRGQIRALIKHKAKEGDLVIKTQLAAMAIRGTEILANHRTVNSLEVSEFALLSGSAQVTEVNKNNHDLLKSDKIIIVQDSQKRQAHEKIQLSQQELLSLNATKINEEKEFKPFMPLWEPEKLNKNSSLSTFLQNAPAPASEVSAPHDKKIENKKNWRENLKKLNEKLRENQQ